MDRLKNFTIARFVGTVFFVFVLAFVIHGVFAVTTTWDFGTDSDYQYNSDYIEITGGVVSLKALDQTDDDNTSLGFGGGTHTNTQFLTDHIELNSTGITNTTGTFSSRIFDAGTSTSWSLLP